MHKITFNEQAPQYMPNLIQVVTARGYEATNSGIKQYFYDQGHKGGIHIEQMDD